MEIACPTCQAEYEIDGASVADAGRKVRCAACTTVWRVLPGGRLGEIISAPQVAEPKIVEKAVVPDLEAPAQVGEVEPFLVDVDNNSDQSLLISMEAPLEPPPEVPDEGNGSSIGVPDSSPMEETAVPAVTQDNMPALESVEPETPPSPKRVRWAKEPRAPKPPPAWRKALMSPASAIAVVTALTLGAAIHQRNRVVDALPQAAPLFAALGLPVNLRGVAIANVASRLVDDNGLSILVVDGDLRNVTAQPVDVPRLRFAVLDGKGQEIYIWSAQPDRAKLQPGETLNFRRRLASPPADARDVSVRFVTRADITAGIR